jgi:hypothetical protein
MDQDNNEIAGKITKLGAELESLLGPIFAAFAEKAQAENVGVIALVGAMHMTLCCMLAKVYAMATHVTPADRANPEAREYFLDSVRAGTEHFLDLTEEKKPQLVVEALLKSMGKTWSNN